MESKTQELLRLIKENPNLPVVPMVEGEVCGDDSSLWLGSWGDSELNEYYVGRERVHFKGDDVEDVLYDMEGCRYGCDKIGRDLDTLSDEEWGHLYAAIPWVRCIVVYITT